MGDVRNVGYRGFLLRNIVLVYELRNIVLEKVDI